MPRLILTILAIVTSVLFSNGAITGSWKNHPAMQTVTYTNPHHTVRIIPGATRTYFLVHANMYYSNGPDYNNLPYLTLFYHDNDADIKDGCLKPVDELVGNMPYTLIDCAYSVNHNFLFGIFDNGEIFAIHDNGTFLRGERINRSTTPGNLKINGISFDPTTGDVWVATERGVSAFDRKTLSKTTEISSDHEINAVGIVGDRLIVAFTESDNEMPTLRTAAMDNLPLKVSEFSPVMCTNNASVNNVMTSDNRIVCLSDITPLSKYTFAFLSVASSGQGLSVNILSFINDDCRLLQLHSQPMTVIPNTYKANTNYEGFVTACSDGFNFKLQNLLHIASGFDPDPLLDDGKAIEKFKQDCGWKQINVESDYNGCDMRNAKAASWNNRDYWFYISSKGFIRRTIDAKEISGTSADKTWLYSSETVMMNAPNVHHASYFSWHPQLGMLCRQHGPDNFFKITGAHQLDQLCGYKNGKWTPYGLAVRNYDSRLVHYDNFGIAIDPDKPEYVYSGSYMTGLLRLNLNDSSDLLHITTGNDYKPTNRNFDVKISDYLDIFTQTKAWSYFSEPRFDADGNLWTAYFWGLDCNRGETIFCCWDRNDRIESANTKSATGFRQWKCLHVKSGIDRTNRQLLLPLKNERNKNLLVYNAGDYGSKILIYDHAGTIDNTADDRYVIIESPIDSLGRQIEYDYANALFEDPMNGNVWLLTQTGVYWFDPILAFGASNRMNRLELADAADYNGRSVILETFGANAMCADNKGRKWIGSHHGGIICISPDSSTLLAHITKDNSQLADNSVTALAWNPDNNSLMISTLKGIQEFFPEDGTAASEKDISVYPEIVTPGFFGFVTMTALDNSKEYELVNQSTGTVINLGRPIDGILQWNIRNDKSGRAEAGEYCIRVINQTKVLNRFMVIE